MEEKITKILKKYEVSLGYVFGSHARGTAGPLSDVDVAVAFPYSMNHNEEKKRENTIKHEIQAICMTDRVDIINLRRNENIVLGHRILFEGKALLVEDPGLKHALELKYLHNFEDTKHLRHAQFTILRNKIHVTN